MTSNMSQQNREGDSNSQQEADLAYSFPNIFGRHYPGTTASSTAMSSAMSSAQPTLAETVERFRQNISLPYVQSRLSYTSSAGINGSGGAGRGILAIAGRGRSSSLGNPVSVPLVRPSGHGLTTCAGRPGQLSQAGRLNTPVYRRRIRNQAATSTGKKFTKSVILVNYGEKEVPRGKRRQTLQKAGAIIDLVDFYTDWSEEKVREVIESALRGILDSSQPQPRFTFQKAVSKWLLTPNVPPGHSWTGEKVQHLAKHGDIYVMPTYPLQIGGQDDETTMYDSSEDFVPTLECSEHSSESGPSRVPGPSRVHHLFEADSSNDSNNYCPPGPSHASYEFPEAEQSGAQQSRDPGPGPSGVQQSSDQNTNVTPFNLSPLPELSPDTDIVEADVILLTEIFPDASPSHIRDMRINTGLSLDKVVEVLLAKKPAAVVPTTQTLLENLASQVIDFNNDITIIVNRNVLYNKAKVWYKCAMADPSRLKKNLMIHFTGESGIDADALRNEFFTRVLHDINEELFEGPPDRRIPKNLWDADKEFQMAGIIASHSILLGGPGFNCLHPLMYDWMINPSKEPMENLPTASDIPQTAANVDLIELISKMDAASTQEEIDEIVDQPNYQALINSSGWPAHRLISPGSKGTFLNGLVIAEFQKRSHLMRYFANGLCVIGLYDVVCSHPNELRSVFVYKGDKLTPEAFLGIIKSRRPEDEQKAQAYDWFVSYVKERGTQDNGMVTLEDILSFTTGLRDIPPLGLKENGGIVISYLRNLDTKVFPMADACFNNIKLPVCHSSKEDFFAKMDQGIGNSLNFFGRL